MADPKVLGISGSLRAGSNNTKLLREAVRLFGACEFTLANLRFPLYDGDLEDAIGLPPEVVTLVDQIRAADAIMIATPEYNRMIPGVLKNALDWVSRSKPKPFAGKPVALMATGGHHGGAISLFTLRHALAPFDVRLVPGMGVSVPNGDLAFDADGQLLEDWTVASLTRLMELLREEI